MNSRVPCALSCLLAALIVLEPVAAADKKGQVSGTVLDFETGKGLAGVGVSAKDGQGKEVKKAVTNRLGGFVIKDLPAQELLLEFRKIGYLRDPEPRKVVVAVGAGTNQDVELVPQALVSASEIDRLAEILARRSNWLEGMERLRLAGLSDEATEVLVARIFLLAKPFHLDSALTAPASAERISLDQVECTFADATMAATNTNSGATPSALKPTLLVLPLSGVLVKEAEAGAFYESVIEELEERDRVRLVEAPVSNPLLMRALKSLKRGQPQVAVDLGVEARYLLFSSLEEAELPSGDSPVNAATRVQTWLVDRRTRHVVEANHCDIKPRSGMSVGFTSGLVQRHGDLGRRLSEVGREAGLHLSFSIPEWSEFIVEVRGDRIILSAGQESGLGPDTWLKVFRPPPSIHDSATGQVMPGAREEIGILEVVSVGSGSSEAVLRRYNRDPKAGDLVELCLGCSSLAR